MKISLFSVCLFTALFAASTSAQSVSKAALAQDLAYTVKTVSEVHPALVNEGVRKKLEAKAASLTQTLPDDVPRWRVGVTVAERLRVVNDAHTTADLTFGSSRYLPLSFAWLSDGLVVAPVAGSKVEIPVASKVLKIGGLDTETLEHRLSQLISENRYWIQEMSAYVLPAESVLRWLGVVQDDAVTLMIRTPEDVVKTVKVGLTDYELVTSRELDERLREARGLSGPWQGNLNLAAYRIDADENYGIFWLPTCKNTDEYRFWVERFFRAVAAAGVENVVISVQQNSGGSSDVIDVLLEHLPILRYRVYSAAVKRYSKAVQTGFGLSKQEFERGAKRHQGSLSFSQFDEEAVESSLPIFSGNVYVLTDSGTFSSALDLANVLDAAHVATLVGEATGGSPTSYGNVLDFTTPNLKLPFRVASAFWKRSDPSSDPADTLMPDIPLPVTVKAVQTGHSPIKMWLEGLARAVPSASPDR